MFSPIYFPNFVHKFFSVWKKKQISNWSKFDENSTFFLLFRISSHCHYIWQCFLEKEKNPDYLLPFSIVLKLVQTCLNLSKHVQTGPNLMKLTHFFLFLEEVVIVTTSDNVVEKKKRTRTTSVAVFHGVDGNPLERNVVENITQFQVRSNLLKLV